MAFVLLEGSPKEMFQSADCVICGYFSEPPQEHGREEYQDSVHMSEGQLEKKCFNVS